MLILKKIKKKKFQKRSTWIQQTEYTNNKNFLYIDQNQKCHL